MTATTATTAVRPRRVLAIVSWTLQVLLGAFFIFVSVPKLTLHPDVVVGFSALGTGHWFIYFVGACELAGGIGLMIPRLSGVAAIGLAGLMIGATITNLFLLPGMASAAVVTVALGVAFVFIARLRARQTRALIRQLKR
ncbi:MAG TPA: DoxX family protein [Candidatus Limnocylindrales bacterium]|nr:DoxX family protein [Candidatus Limnocylindrales bacterium]